MASVFKPKGSDRYVIVYHDGTKRRKKMGTKDKSVSQRIANDLENKVALRKAGIVDPREEAYALMGRQPSCPTSKRGRNQSGRRAERRSMSNCIRLEPCGSWRS